MSIFVTLVIIHFVHSRLHHLMDEYTFTDNVGFDFRAYKPITTFTVIELCRSLDHNFGDGYQFTPADDWDIQMKTWPGRQLGAYKAIKLLIPTRVGIWPSELRWSNNNLGSHVICHMQEDDTIQSSILGSIKYIAYYGAPCWTIDEIMKVEASFTRVELLPLIDIDKQIYTELLLVKKGKMGKPSRKRAVREAESIPFFLQPHQPPPHTSIQTSDITPVQLFV